MQRSFQSKIGIGFYLLLVSGLILLVWFLWFKLPMLSAVCAAYCIFLTQMLLRTDYIIRGDGSLFLSAGFMPVRTISIDTIQRIEIRKGCPGPYAVSNDGIVIVYARTKRVRVSPKDKAGFISELKKYRPAIRVEEKGKLTDKKSTKNNQL